MIKNLAIASAIMAGLALTAPTVMATDENNVSKAITAAEAPLACTA